MDEQSPITISSSALWPAGLLDDAAVDFDMLQTGHESWSKAANTVAWMSAHYSQKYPSCHPGGESFYEGTQQTNWQDMERFDFWACMMNGALAILTALAASGR